MTIPEGAYALVTGKLSKRAREELQARVIAGEQRERVELELLLREEKAILGGPPCSASTSSG